MAVRQRQVDKRRAILDAAAPIFGTLGYERASVEAIAAAAGVSKPTIYTYFGGKDGLFRESLADSAVEQNGDALAAIGRLDLTAEGWRDSLHALGLRLVTCQQDSCARFLRRHIAAESTRDPEIYRLVRATASDPILEALAGRLAMLGNAGRLRVPDPTLAARQFLALVTAEMPDLTENDTRDAAPAEVRRAVDAGVRTFVAAHTPS
ncbi:Transcriptional regulator [Frankia canadensis]|uniref:Transcriptional regulator n=1 Tax=Frankia canadensis TaxID=1836972 RepID=A0A2I2KSJ3_9ACTN|nr:TetR/AcrR family transcriptional regulator [Frankia canadensis]SNQ48641.1 Transcriptional regulator [Frankia canadensis]SOU55931.1 Transcriptional regulator [Frankia canadensis]